MLRSTKRNCPLLAFHKGSERSVSVFLRFLIFLVESFSNRLERCSGTSPFNDLYFVAAVSRLIMSLTFGKSQLHVSAIAGVSNLLLVTHLVLDSATFAMFAV